jgi:hypothetical protein
MRWHTLRLSVNMSAFGHPNCLAPVGAALAGDVEPRVSLRDGATGEAVCRGDVL